MNVGARTLEQIRHAIQDSGYAPAPDRPLTVALDEEGTRVEAQVLAYDSLGVAVQGLTVWGDNRVASLEALSKTISQRVTYLWEPLALIERDLERDEVQIRSAPPLAEDKTVEFFEGRLTRHDGSLRLHLVRLRQADRQARRANVPITVTHQVFRRLVNDLAAILRAPETG